MKLKFKSFPHPITMLFVIIVIVTGMSYILPAGEFERVLVNGRMRVVSGTFKNIANTPLTIMDMFRSFVEAFKVASDIIFVVLASGIMFGILEKSKMIEHAVGTLVKRMGEKRRVTIVILMTYLFGLLGVAVGYENNIAMIPIGAVLAIAIGGDLILAAGMSVAAITVGFGLSPINPYTVGTGHQIAELPLFSGAGLRSVLCFLALSCLAYYNMRYFKKITNDPLTSMGQGLDTSGLTLTKPIDQYAMSANNILVALVFLAGMVFMLYGVFNFHWYLKEIAAIFLIITLVAGLVSKMNPTEISETVLKSVSVVAPGAFMVGFATTIKVILEKGNISDTIAHTFSNLLMDLPVQLSAIVMSFFQCIMNLMIPSGSGQALATLPVMIPVGDLIGITRQCTILAFQIGDGVTNLFNPTLGGLIAMLSLCRVPFDKWLKFILPLTGVILVISWLILWLCVLINWT